MKGFEMSLSIIVAFVIAMLAVGVVSLILTGQLSGLEEFAIPHVGFDAGLGGSG